MMEIRHGTGNDGSPTIEVWQAGKLLRQFGEPMVPPVAAFAARWYCLSHGQLAAAFGPIKPAQG